ncbi:RICIN domain-containing protein [Streptomyces coffeae]|uniref:RICIN domain-containing protein n=1 Tax=Streptomyces coffeae TaxID=621382 RepID=A0ABS1NRN9_9ACTN|nr:RICIN domain-containing protein [Streptomyces coffeae]MBL1102770.1 RICIN domain-containing protein [Streptomyces coffeae]
MMRACDAVDAQWHPDDSQEPGAPLRWHNSAHPELCLTATRRQDALVMALPCTDSRAQMWWGDARAVSTWSDGDQQVRLRAANGLYLATQNGAGADGTPLTTYQQWRSQRWDIQYADMDSNLVRLKAPNANKCATIPDDDVGARAVLQGCSRLDSKNDGMGSRWLAEPYADGSVRLRNEATHRCLTPPPWEGGDVEISVCTDQAYQRWTIEP